MEAFWKAHPNRRNK